MAEPIPRHANLSDTAFMDLQKLLLELGIKPRATANSVAKSSNVDSDAVHSPKDHNRDSSSDSDDMNSDSDTGSVSDANSGAGTNSGHDRDTVDALGRNSPPHGTPGPIDAGPIDDPEATDSDPDMRLAPERPETTTTGVKARLRTEKKKKQ